MAEVFVGRHVAPDGQFGPVVAVKRMLPHLSTDPTIVQMFFNEARVTAQIHHRNVVRIHEVGTANGEPFIAMELLDGRTWADLRNKAAESARRMPIGVALRILTEACRGLDAAHRALDDSGQPLSLVHRDFTPENIHVGVKGDIKVIDFGIARTASLGSGTEPGTLKGKFFYMSPEMILSKPVDHRADIFAAGAMLYEQLCGRRPFTGTTVDEVVKKIAAGQPVPMSVYDPAIPRELEAAGLHALERDPQQRFQTLGELVSAIEAIGGAAQLATSEEVGAYVSALFPEATDPRRQTVRRARTEKTPMAQPPTPLARPAALPPPYEPLPLSGPLPQARRGSLAMWLGLSAVAALAAAGSVAFLVNRPSSTPAQVLEAARLAATPAERAKLLRRLIDTPGSTNSQLLQAGAEMLGAGQYDELLEFTEGWQQRSPKSLDALLLEGTAAVHRRLGKRAETAIKAANALAPTDARPDAILGELRELQGDAGGALDAWTRASTKSPMTARYLARQGYWLSQMGQLDSAANVLSRALKTMNDPALSAELAFVRFRQEHLEDAQKLLRNVIKEKPELLEGHYYLGAVLFRKGDIKGARLEYLEADRLAGVDPRPLTALCEMEALQQASELEEAKALLRKRFPKEAAAIIEKCAP
jgi:tetratricopeptide (TPR) repeat protein